jgi:hypothetical protein
MIYTPTLFILGAGASKPYGYLTGAELRADIIKNFAADFNKPADAIKPNVSSDADMARECIPSFIKNFDNSSLKSIDKYLAINPKDRYIGKIAITLSILKSERDSCFNGKIDDAREDWYQYIYNRMTENCKKPGDHEHFFENNRVAFVTFNYDRSLEYFLYRSFYHSFNQERRLIENNIKKYVPFKIIHVYGTVGGLSLEDWYGGSRNYGQKFESFNLVESRSNLITVIGEEREGENIKEQIKKLLPDCKRIFFLGFGYAQDNLDAIDLPKNINQDWKIFGDAKGMTLRERNEARTRINAHFRDKVVVDLLENPIIKDTDSCALLREYL